MADEYNFDASELDDGGTYDVPGVGLVSDGKVVTDVAEATAILNRNDESDAVTPPVVDVPGYRPVDSAQAATSTAGDAQDDDAEPDATEA